MSDNINWTWLRRFFLCFHRQNPRKRSRVDTKAPVFNRGMTYQTKEKGLTKVTLNLFGGGSNRKNDICKSGYRIAFVFVRTVSETCSSDIN